jgi:hypothetical protein
MQTVISTPEFLSQAKKHGLSQDEINAIVEYLTTDPLAGEVMVGTGGARKLRHAGKVREKSGGYGTIHYYGGNDIRVFLLTVYGKGAAANLTKAERNALAKILPVIGDAYSETTKKLASQPSKQRPKGPNQ